MKKIIFFLLVFSSVFSKEAWSPNFMIVGAQKSGTTVLYEYITSHPYVQPCKTKEPHFFDVRYNKGIAHYRTFFPKKLTFTGEASPYYLLHPLVPKRVFSHFPKTKIIIMLRNPVERAYSQYQMNKRKRKESLSFEEALSREEVRLKGEEAKLLSMPNYASRNFRYFSYCRRGLYAEQIERWLAFFPKEQVLIILYEDFKKDNFAILDQVFDFLGLPPHSPKKILGKKSSYAPMKPETRQMLSDYFAPHNQELEELLGIETGWE